MKLPLKQGLALAALCLAAQAQAVNVTYTRQDLADTTPGVDLFKHHYILEGGMAEGDSLAMIFDHALAGTIVSLDVQGPFDKLIIQPNPGMDIDGLAILEATDDVPGGTYQLSFDIVFSSLAPWPATQQFSYRFAGDEIGFTFTALQVSGDPPATTVPEPTAAGLTLSALGLLAGFSRLSRRRQPGLAAPALQMA
jgi:hypothetical protein